MQHIENRAFDHYFGTMAGVRGFDDANLQMNGDRSVYQQQITAAQSTEVDYLQPWYINYLGGDWIESTQCMYAGSNSWTENHKAYNKGKNDRWVLDQNPWSIGFYKRDDLPVHWALAENFVIGDMYQESVIASTSPNRVTWASGSINVPGGPQRPDQGGNPYIDNNENDGCEAGGINCYPLKWKTAPEFWEEAGVSWSVFQDADNFDDNPLAWFEQFQKAKKGSALYNKGMKGQSLQNFYDRAANGTLPAVSIIVGPMELSEHPPYSPHDGAWLQRKVAQAVIDSPKFKSSALIVSYDETGGWYDHLSPFHSPEGTAGEWLNDPWAGQGYTFAGPGFRVPFYIVSPFTRHGGVYTEHSDHNSQLLFVEKWLAAKGKNVTTNEMVPWRRQNMGDLVAAFDFRNPDASPIKLPDTPAPHKNAAGNYDGAEHCNAQYKEHQPPVPYTKAQGAVDDMRTLVEHGFKPIRGQLTEGRYLTIESGAIALAVVGDVLAIQPASEEHDDEAQRWIVHSQDNNYGNTFTLQSVLDDRYVCKDGRLCTSSVDAQVFTIRFTPSEGYTIQDKSSKKVMSARKGDTVPFFAVVNAFKWDIFSVSYY